MNAVEIAVVSLVVLFLAIFLLTRFTKNKHRGCCCSKGGNELVKAYFKAKEKEK
ncbi:MAG: hypothetical protein SPG64_05635 [Candidatus Enteromonas sp.]|nr:hypothetical protein [Candidatus Enteromonas sp.]